MSPLQEPPAVLRIHHRVLAVISRFSICVIPFTSVSWHSFVGKDLSLLTPFDIISQKLLPLSVLDSIPVTHSGARGNPHPAGGASSGWILGPLDSSPSDSLHFLAFLAQQCVADSALK